MTTTMCDKKKFSLKGAKHVLFEAKMARAFGSQKRLEQRYYYCDHCNAYHLTSKEFKVFV